MDRRDFESLVTDLDRSARLDPKSYRTKVALMAALGYLFISGLLLILLSLSIGAVVFVYVIYTEGNFLSIRFYLGALVLLISLATSIRAVVEGLSVKVPEPEGGHLTRDLAPDLFKHLDILATKLNAPKIDDVMIDTDFNAAIAQIPQHGLFGKCKNYLLIGIPMMKALSPEQFTAVLAHEFGHLSGEHSKFEQKIYRLHNTWESLLSGVRDDMQIIRGFLNWYVPRFMAYTFALRRSDEYEADKCAVEFAGRDPFITGLLASNVYGAYLTLSYWKSFDQRAMNSMEPDVKPYTEMFSEQARPTKEQAEVYLRLAFRRKTDLDDTHPCLSERLAALGYRRDKNEKVLPVPEFPTVTAAQHFLGDWYKKYDALIDEEWITRHRSEWIEIYAHTENRRRKLEIELLEYEEGALNAERAREVAQDIYDLQSKEDGLAFLQELTTANPDDAENHYALGTTLLSNNNESGITSLKEAVRLNRSFLIDASMKIANFFERNGYPEQAEPYYEVVKKNVGYGQLLLGRIPFTRHDTFTFHGLTPDVVAKVKAHLGCQYYIRTAYLVQSVRRANPDRPTYVLLVIPDCGVDKTADDFDLDIIAQGIYKGIDLKGDVMIEFAAGRMKWLKGPISRVSGSRIFDLDSNVLHNDLISMVEWTRGGANLVKGAVILVMIGISCFVINNSIKNAVRI